jgi:hypothetical protein
MEQEKPHHKLRILLYVHKEDNFIIDLMICSYSITFAIL